MNRNKSIVNEDLHNPTKWFFDSVPSYYSVENIVDRKETTLSRAAAHTVVDLISSSLSGANHQRPAASAPLVVDLAGGIGYYSLLLSQRIPASNYLVLDLSLPMVHVGKQEALSQGTNIHFASANAYTIPLSDNAARCVLLFSAIHLFEEKRRLLTEIRRILAPAGCLWILTFDPQDIQSTIYHRYFPGFCDIDLRRYKEMTTLLSDIQAAGFDQVQMQKIEYEIIYESVKQVVRLVASKPFSTFSFFSQQKFMLGLETFESNLTGTFGSAPVINRSQMTLLQVTGAPGSC